MLPIPHCWPCVTGSVRVAPRDCVTVSLYSPPWLVQAFPKVVAVQAQLAHVLSEESAHDAGAGAGVGAVAAVGSGRCLHRHGHDVRHVHRGESAGYATADALWCLLALPQPVRAHWGRRAPVHPRAQPQRPSQPPLLPTR